MNIDMNDIRHAKIAQLLEIAWDCNLADSEDAHGWTIPKMATSVVCPLHNAVRGLLDADYNDYLNAHAAALDGGKQPMLRCDFKDEVMLRFDDNRVGGGRNKKASVTHFINCVIADNPPTKERSDFWEAIGLKLLLPLSNRRLHVHRPIYRWRFAPAFQPQICGHI